MSRFALDVTCAHASGDRFAILRPGSASRLGATKRLDLASSERAVCPPRTARDFEPESRADCSTEARFDRLGSGAHVRPSFNAIRFQHTTDRAGGYGKA